MPTYDFFFPGHWLFRDKPADIKYRGHTNWVAVVPYVTINGTLEFREEPLTDPLSLFEDEGKEVNIEAGSVSMAIWGSLDKSLDKDASLPYGKKRDCKIKNDTHFEYMEYAIERHEIDKYPGLIDKIKLAMTRRDSGGNTHRDFMNRINSIPELVEIIVNFRSQTSNWKRPKQAPVEQPRQKKQKTVTIQLPGENAPETTYLVKEKEKMTVTIRLPQDDTTKMITETPMVRVALPVPQVPRASTLPHQSQPS